jgi:hypothetical protein
MYKIGRCSQDPHNYVKRLKCYPKGSKICFVFIVPDDRVVDIETELIEAMNEEFECVHGKEYFHGNEKAILAMLSAKMHALYTAPDTRCDTCEIPVRQLHKQTENPYPADDKLSDCDKAEILQALRCELNGTSPYFEKKTRNRHKISRRDRFQL